MAELAKSIYIAEEGPTIEEGEALHLSGARVMRLMVPVLFFSDELTVMDLRTTPRCGALSPVLGQRCADPEGHDGTHHGDGKLSQMWDAP